MNTEHNTSISDEDIKTYKDALELIDFYLYKLQGTELDYWKGNSTKMFSDIKIALEQYPKLKEHIQKIEKALANADDDNTELQKQNEELKSELQTRKISQIHNDNYVERLQQENNKLKQGIEGNLCYIRLLQDGDPENEDSKKILDYLEKELQQLLKDDTK